MAKARLESVLGHLRQLVARQSAGRLSDGQLLERFATQRDEVAFATLMRRHGQMVLNVARRVLHCLQDAEEVFQATFLVLACKAPSIRKHEALGCWLHGVAHRLALKARAELIR